MKRMVSAREIVGKRIVAFDPGPFDDGRGQTAHNPRIVLDDGSVLFVTVKETDTGDYGVFMGRHKPERERA